jgi:K+-transporting ATPase KdpF subunit
VSGSGKTMDITTIVVIVLTIGLLAYLVIALLFPEKF